MTAFLLDENGSTTSFRAMAEPRNLYDPFALKRGDASPPAALRFRWKMGSKNAGHVVWTDGAELLVSKPFIALLEKFSGWVAFPAILEGARKQISEEYFYLVVTGRCGRYLQNKTVRLIRTDVAFDLYRGLCFAETRTAPDLSMPENPSLRFVFVNERVCSAIKSLRCSNVDLTPCDEVILQPWVYLAVLEKSGEIGPRKK